ncbi:MAG: hypothetical protein PW788_13060 [Micavibrio sp.]|nr:hypothetical protein [Micavibrio sp.]
MIASLKLQILFSIFITLGCIVSTVFASAVLAGALAAAIGCFYAISKIGGHDHPLNRVNRRFMAFVTETAIPAVINAFQQVRAFSRQLRDKFEEYQLNKAA